MCVCVFMCVCACVCVRVGPQAVLSVCLCGSQMEPELNRTH